MADVSAPPGVETNKLVVRRFFDEVWNEGRFDVLDELIAPDAADHDPQSPFPELRGPEMVRRTVSMYRSAFPDTHMRVEAMIADGDLVATRWTATGTHEGELMGLAPTRRRVELTGMSFDRFDGGRVVETWTNWDTLGLMRQLGAAPEPGSMGEKVGITMQRFMARRSRSHG